MLSLKKDYVLFYIQNIQHGHVEYSKSVKRQAQIRAAVSVHLKLHSCVNMFQIKLSFRAIYLFSSAEKLWIIKKIY